MPLIAQPMIERSVLFGVAVFGPDAGDPFDQSPDLLWLDLAEGLDHMVGGVASTVTLACCAAGI